MKIYKNRLVLFFFVLLFSIGCFSLLPSETLAQQVLQSAFLAGVVGVVVFVSHPRMVKEIKLQKTPLNAWVWYVLMVGALGGVASWVLQNFDGGALVQGDSDLSFVAMRFVLIVALCLCVGVYEEGLFRVLAYDAFSDAMTPLRAALVASFLFGILHVSVSEIADQTSWICWAQYGGKILQASLFGFIMVALYHETQNFWFLAGVHTLFDVVYLGPLLLSGELQQTYATGSLSDLLILWATVILLILPAYASFRTFRPYEQNA